MTFLFLLIFQGILANEAVELQYRFNKGEMSTYKERIDITLRGDFLIEPEKKDSLEFYRTEKVLQHQPEILLLTTYEGLEDPGELFESSMPVSKVNGVPVEVNVDPNGRFSNLKWEGMDSFSSSEIAQIRNYVSQINFLLPDKPVKPGDDWDQQISMTVDSPILKNMDQIIDLKYTFKGLESFQGKTIARIVVSGSLRGAVDQGQFGSFIGNIKGYFLFDPDQGKELRSEVEYDIEANLIFPEGDFFYTSTMKLSRNKTESASVR